MKVVFLDIDGVMNSLQSVEEAERLGITIENPWYGPDFSGAPISPAGFHYFAPWSVRALNRITDATGAVIVISSTWRKSAVFYLRRWGVTGDIIDATPRLERRSEGGIYIAKQRGDEIQAWIDSWFSKPGGRPIERFVILDDSRDMAHLMELLIQTDASARGLTDEHATRAIAMLQQEKTE